MRSEAESSALGDRAFRCRLDHQQTLPPRRIPASVGICPSTAQVRTSLMGLQFVSRLFTRRCVRLSLAVPRRTFADKPSQTPPPPPTFPTIATCPQPTCPCAVTPGLPDGLEIDRASSLNGVMAAYAEHVLICTGRHDWPSRIEDENSGDNLAADLKELFGRGGIYSDVSVTEPLRALRPFYEDGTKC
jgi:hypothetical protein